MRELKWTEAEKKLSRRAFDVALQAELAEVLRDFKARAAAAQSPEDIWPVEHFLGAPECPSASAALLPLRQPPRNVKYAQDLDNVSPHAVRNDISSPRNDEFPRPGHPAWTTKPGLPGQVTHGGYDACDYKTSCGRIIFSDVGGLRVQICKSLAQPPNAHSASTCG